MKTSAIKRKLKFSTIAVRKSEVDLQRARITSEQLQQSITQENDSLQSTLSIIAALEKKLDSLITAGNWQLHEMLRFQLHEMLAQQNVSEVRLSQLQRNYMLQLHQGFSLKLKNTQLAKRVQQYSVQQRYQQSRRAQCMGLSYSI